VFLASFAFSGDRLGVQAGNRNGRFQNSNFDCVQLQLTLIFFALNNKLNVAGYGRNLLGFPDFWPEEMGNGLFLTYCKEQ
jgi:hypothetical protein